MSKTNGIIDLAMLEHFVRDDLNQRAHRAMAVLRPLKVVIDNYPEGQVEELEVVNNPEDASAGTRNVPFSRVLYIEQDDFREVPPKKFFRLSPGQEVRLRGGYFITCKGAMKNEQREKWCEVHCTYDPQTRSGNAPDNRKVKATIHWVSVQHAIDAEVRLYENLFTKEDPSDVPEGQDFTANLNPSSLEVLTGAKLEPSLAGCECRATVSSSSGWATSASIWIQSRERWSSIAPCPCATPGRGLRSENGAIRMKIQGKYFVERDKFFAMPGPNLSREEAIKAALEERDGWR